MWITITIAALIILELLEVRYMSLPLDSDNENF